MDINLSATLNVSTEYSKVNTKDSEPDKTKNKEEKKSDASAAAVYEKSQDNSDTGTYRITKMSQSDRSALVEQLKKDQETRELSLQNLARDMISKQAGTFSDANDIWNFLREGKFTVDAETKAKAQQDISEDGYYGVKQTSQRLFDFACALAGDDEKTLNKMQKAIEKGYKQAEKTWGGELPQICKDTLEATNKLFEEYYQSKKTETASE